ncbi:MAG: molybdopterin biosynthesis protein MoeB, partial [Xanthomonas sp.]|nr:molybdopterin biosynthesis protein MoeB [Xanthomonas sp.]
MAIREIEPRDVAALLAQGSVFIDVREDHERASGQAEGARGIAKGTLERDHATHLPDRDASIVLICQKGGRSM